MRIKKRSGLVYSSEHGSMCPRCERPQGQCQCSQSAPKGSGDGIIRVGRETKGRKGSGVSVIDGLPLRTEDLQSLAKEIKNRCGTGGTVKNFRIEIQGDQRKKIAEILQDKGFKVKIAGG